MTTEQIITLAGALLAILFEYFPGLAGWFEGKGKAYKRLLMLASMALIVGAGFALSCYGRSSAFTCDNNGIWNALTAFVLALAANQGTHLLIKKG